MTLQSIYTGDHGKEKLRFGSKLVVRYDEPASDKPSKWTSVYPLADAKCKKDNGDIFKNTIKNELAKGINAIERDEVNFHQNKETKKWECTLVSKEEEHPDDDIQVDVLTYMIGDLKFLSVMLGKENFEGLWCFLCQLYHDDWKEHGHAAGNFWDLDELRRQAEKVKTEVLDGKDRKGVREDPYFDIPVDHYIWPVLHILIGIGNAILAYLVDIVENEIQQLPPKELILKREVKELEQQLEDTRAWTGAEAGSGKQLVKNTRGTG